MKKLLLKYRSRYKDDEKQTHRLKDLFHQLRVYSLLIDYETHGVLIAAEHRPHQHDPKKVNCLMILCSYFSSK